MLLCCLLLLISHSCEVGYERTAWKHVKLYSMLSTQRPPESGLQPSLVPVRNSFCFFPWGWIGSRSLERCSPFVRNYSWYSVCPFLSLSPCPSKEIELDATKSSELCLFYPCQYWNIPTYLLLLWFSSWPLSYHSNLILKSKLMP